MAVQSRVLVAMALLGVAGAVGGCQSSSSASSPATSTTTQPTVIVNGKPMGLQEMSEALGQAISNELTLQGDVAALQGQVARLHSWAQCVDSNLQDIQSRLGVSEYCGASEP